MEKQNIKIKRSKGRLYKKKRSAGRRVMEIILMVLAVGILGVVGYSAAGPLISYFKGEGETSTTPWEPPESSTPEESDTSDSESSPDTTTHYFSDGSGAYVLSANALVSPSSLIQELSGAESAGCSVIILPVKTEDGLLLYSSQISSVKDTELVAGSMTASQIVGVVKDRGFERVVALVPALYDKSTPQYVADTGYRFADESYAWLDAAANNGGKQWVDPFRGGTRNYYTQLVRELTGAGFDEVLLSEMRFPKFTTYDQTILDQRNFAGNRYTALTSLYSSVNSAAGGGKTAVAVDIADVLAGFGKSYGGTAEILSDRSFTGTVYLMIDLSRFGTTLDTEENGKVTLPSDPAQKVTTLVSKAAGYIGTNLTVVPVVRAEGMTAEQLKRCYDALDSGQ